MFTTEGLLWSCDWDPPTRVAADSTGKAFIIIDIPHSYPITFIAAHAVTSEALMRSSPMGGVLVSGGKAAAAAAYSGTDAETR